MRSQTIYKTWSRVFRLRILTVILVLVSLYFLTEDRFLSKLLQENSNKLALNSTSEQQLVIDEEIGSADEENVDGGIPAIQSIDLTGGNKKQDHSDINLHLESNKLHEKPSLKGLTTLGGSGIYVTHDLHQTDPEESEYLSQISKKLPSEISREISETALGSKIYSEKEKQPVLMYYNRIPKCGSTSLGNLLNATGEKNGKFQIKHEHYRGIRFSFKNDRTKKV